MYGIMLSIPKNMQNFQKRTFCENWINAPIVAYPVMKDIVIAIREFMSIVILFIRLSPISAAKTAGMLMRKLSFSDSFALYFRSMSPAVVMPDLEMPGMAEIER